MTSSAATSVPPGIIYRVDGESLNTLIEKYEKSLSTNTSEQERLDKLRQEYLTLKSKLTTLPKKLEYDALVPLCRRALCPGKIIHTNEITCLLGDNWFVECSAEKAIELVNHRITKLDEKQEGLKKERELINNWKQEAERQLVETIGEGTVEIREDYDEDYEKHWKEKHRDSVRRYHQQKAKERLEAQQEKNNVKNDMWTRLDELEIQEELESYLEEESITDDQLNNKIQQTLAPENQPPTRNYKPNEVETKNTLKQSSTVSTLQEKTEKPSTNPPAIGKRVKFSTDNIVHNISEDRSFANQDTDTHIKPLATTLQTGFTDDNTMSSYPCFEPIMIRFRHSSLAEMGEDEDANTSGTEEEDNKYQIVASPGEIVKVFGPTSVSAISNKPSPKSILKPYAPPLVADKKSKKGQSKTSSRRKPSLSFLDEDENSDADNEPTSAMSKIVTERVPVFTTLQLNTQTAINDEVEDTSVAKPVSLFKMRRQQQAVVTSPE